MLNQHTISAILLLRNFWRQYFAYFFHLHYVLVQKLQVKINKTKVYQDSQPLPTWTLKSNTKFWYLTCKNVVKNEARRRSGAFIVNFEHILHLFLVFLLLTLSR